MIHLIAENNLGEFDADGAVIIRLSEMCDRGNIIEGLLPDSDLALWWESIEHTEDNWTRIQEIECERLNGHWCIDYLCNISNYGKTVNIICTCNDSKFCFRRILNEILVNRDVEVFMQ